jgi:hypothetical protein
MQSVRQRYTFIPAADAGKPVEALTFSRSLFDSMASALPAYGMKIALNPSGKFRPSHLKKDPLRRLP